MARRSGDGGGMSAGPMNTIIAGFIGLLVIVAVVILGPILAGSIENSVTIPNGTCTLGNTSATAPVEPQYGECGLTNTTATSSNDEYDTAFDTWNPTFDSTIPTGVDTWTTNVTIGGVVILVFFIALAIYYIRVIA